MKIRKVAYQERKNKESSWTDGRKQQDDDRHARETSFVLCRGCETLPENKMTQLREPADSFLYAFPHVASRVSRPTHHYFDLPVRSLAFSSSFFFSTTTA
jgi:hypothetical protein